MGEWDVVSETPVVEDEWAVVSESPDIPVLSSAPPQTAWQKATGFIKDVINPHTPGQMAPADIADAQIKMEARQNALTKEAYMRQVIPEGELNRRSGRLAKDVVSGAVGTVEGVAGSVEWITNGAVGRGLANEAKLWSRDLAPEEHGFSDSLAGGVGSMATFFVPGMGVAKGATALAKVTPRLASWLGAGTATAMEAMTEAGTVYRDILNQTRDVSAAESAATKTFWANVPLILVTNKLGVFGETGTQAKRTGMSSLMEASQEGGQEIISTKAAGKPIDWKATGESAAVGALTGAAFSFRPPSPGVIVPPPKQSNQPGKAASGATSPPPGASPKPTPAGSPAAPHIPTDDEILQEGERIKNEAIAKKQAERDAALEAEAEALAAASVPIVPEDPSDWEIKSETPDVPAPPVPKPELPPAPPEVQPAPPVPPSVPEKPPTKTPAPKAPIPPPPAKKPEPVPEPPPVPKPEAPDAEKTTPEGMIAAFVKQRLDEGESLTKKELWDISDQAYGGRKSEGKYNPKDAYDAMEMGINQHIAGVGEVDINANAEDAQATVSALKLLVDRVPTQTTRTEEQDEFQQFSTPPPLAYVVNWAANIQKGDEVLEPSAGVGGIASLAKRVAKTVANELSPRRKALLEQMGFDRVFGENAEQIHNILPKDVRPTVVVMNPPFSATAGRKQGERKTMNATLHINQALARLEEGGRLVAIVGEGMAEGKPTFTGWWTDVKKRYNVRANIGINGNEYKKYGTTFGNQIIIIDKTGPTADKTVTGQVEKIEDLIPLLEEVRNGRNAHAKQTPGKPDGKEGDGASKTGTQPHDPVPDTTGNRGNGSGNSGGTRRPGGRPNSSGQPHPVERGGKTEGSDRPPDRMESGDRQPGDAKEGSGRPGGLRGDGSSGVQQHSDGDSSGVRDGESIPVKTEAKNEETGTQEEQKNPDDIFNEYKVKRLNIPGSQKHPGVLVESAAMAVVSPPSPHYQTSIPAQAIKDGRVSDAQLEAVVYAGQAHEEILSSGERKGFFIGDGTGVGKGREIAAILWDNWNKGRKKALWISKNSPLLKDANRDMEGVGWTKDHLFDLGKTNKINAKIKQTEGIGFVGYGTIRSDSTSKGGQSRVNQIVEWCGPDFDGVIVFDEAHNMGNATDVQGRRGKKKAALQALAGVDLQKRLPKARVVYVSATGATEVQNFSYAQRLGLWGKDTAFSSVRDFIDKISSGGIVVMEVIARDLKALGLYCSRSLSYKGVGYERMEHALTSDQRAAYDEIADAWQIVLRSVEGMIKETGAAGNREARKNARGMFWTANQRFWNQIVTSMQMPTVITAMEKDLKDGKAPVLQFVNTSEAAQKRAVAAMDEDSTPDDLDLSPKDILIQYLEQHYPTQQYQERTDDNGNTIWVPVVDSQGVAVENAEAVAARDELIARIGNLKRIPESPLDMVINHFGAEIVAEVTGRTQRVVERDTPQGRRRVIEKWSTAKSTVDADAFQNDKKKILLFSDAGGTGRSYHADNTAINQRLRRHYVIQPGWRADNAVQGLGRTHRTNEAQPPEYVLVTTDLPGHKRFVSSIARRLNQLGALTKGQQTAGSQGLFKESDNLESTFANDALDNVMMQIAHGEIEAINTRDFVNQSGLEIINERGEMQESKFPDIPKFLNRLLNMSYKMQQDVFDAFSHELDRQLEKAKKDGRSLGGLETIQAKRTEVLDEHVVHTDEKTGAETKLVSLDLIRDAHLLPFAISDQYAKGGYFKNIKSGRIWAAGTQRTTQTKDGHILTVVPLVGPAYGGHNANFDDLNDPAKYTPLSHKDAERLWNEEHANAPTEAHETIHLITGLTLPIWDRLPSGEARIFRVMTNEGALIGRKIKQADLNHTLERLGAGASNVKINADPGNLFDSIMNSKAIVTLANGWKLVRRTVQGEPRIEVRDIDWNSAKLYQQDGLFSERINYDTRWFIPVNREEGVKLITAITSSKPVVSIDNGETGSPIGSQRGAVNLDIFGAPQVAAAIRKLFTNVNPKAAENITIKEGKSDLGLFRSLLASPSALTGKVRYYVVHGKNAMLKQERLRGIVADKMKSIFGKLSKDEMTELQSLEWMGDAEGVNYTPADLQEMGITEPVQAAYIAHRKFHDQVWRMLKIHRKAYGADVEGMKGLEGHVPHMFENWNVYEMEEKEVEGKDGEMHTVKEATKIVGTFRSLREATVFANGLNPEQEYTIKPKAFRMPDDMIARTVLKDSSYFKMVENVEKDFEVTRDEAHGMVKEIARRQNRHRFLGNLMKRKGQSGFKVENVADIFGEYYNGVARYIAMDDFKARVVPKFERDFGAALGSAGKAIRDHNVAQYVESYINDVNGVPGRIESLLNASIMAAPFLAKHVSTQRPSVWAINQMMHVTAVLKLGLLNLSAGIVNMTQLVNTFAKVPPADFAAAFAKVISRRLSSSDRALLKRMGVEYDLGLTDTGGYSAIHKGSMVVNASLFFFRGAEHLNREVTALAAYRAGMAQGMDKHAARRYARKIIDETQFDYSVSDTSSIFRNPVGRFMGQFKPYAIKQIEFIFGLKGAENIKFWIPIMLLAGTAGIPMIEGLTEFIEWLTGTNPLTELKAFLFRWAGDDAEKKAVVRVVLYGVGSTMNVDISRRVGTGDLLPKRPGDLLGPTVSTLLNAKQILATGDKTELVRSLTPAVGNLLTAIETVQNGMEVTDPYHRDRKRYQATGADVAAKAAGFRPVRESELSDVQNIAVYERDKYTKIQQKYVDEAIAALKQENAEAFVAAITKAAEKGVAIDGAAIKAEILQKVLPQEVRMLLRTRKIQRGEQMELNEYLNADGDTDQ